jgi:hypothetical protein
VRIIRGGADSGDNASGERPVEISTSLVTITKFLESPYAEVKMHVLLCSAEDADCSDIRRD